MKQMKPLILLFAILGLASLFIPAEGFTMFAMLKALGMAYLVPVAGGFALAAIAAAIAMKPPAPAWTAAAAVAGFGVVFARMEMWKIGDLFDGPLPIKLLVVAVLGGLAVSIIGLVKKEETA